MSSSHKNDPVSGASRAPETVLVWDLAVRIFHWALIASILAAYMTSDGLGKVHRLAGYTAVGLLIFRIVWGFAGTRHARFSDFVRSPANVLAYIRDILRGHAPRSLGHNPAGGAMILALLAVVAGIGTTGLMMESTRFFGSDWVETVHKSLVYSLFVLVPLHVLGVIMASRSHRENLAASMITGRKPLMGTPGEDETLRRELDTRLRATNGLALAALLTMLVVLGWPQISAQLDVLEKRKAVAAAAAAKSTESTSGKVSATVVQPTSASSTAPAPATIATTSQPATVAVAAPTTSASTAEESIASPIAIVDQAVSATPALPQSTAVSASVEPTSARGLDAAADVATRATLREIASSANPTSSAQSAVAMLTSDATADMGDEAIAQSAMQRTKTTRSKSVSRTRAPHRSSATASTRKSVRPASVGPARRQPRAKRTAVIAGKPALRAATKVGPRTLKKRHSEKHAAKAAAASGKKSGKGQGRGRGRGRGGSSGKGGGNSGKGSSGSSGKGSSGSSGSGSGGGGSSGSGGGGSSGSGGGHGSSGGGDGD